MNPTRILIADDESRIRLMVRTALEPEGYAVEEAADGQEALEAIRRQVPSLMILDLSMPTLDGMGVLRKLRPMPGHQKPRVIVLTAYGSIPVAVQAMRLGAVDFIEKPATPQDLRQTVSSVLEEAEEQAQAIVRIPEGGVEATMSEARRALEASRSAAAEALLTRAEALVGKDPAYFNLLGVAYEMRGDERLARKFYGKAIAARRDYEPAQQNMRRLYELKTFGHSDEPVALGDDEAAYFKDWTEVFGGKVPGKDRTS